ncbi:MAG: hypothetical protein K2W85_15180 [Phycisphaerales bacterium]|nr:hypothetical protein [Phycisphaerales bacterium]
MARNIKQKHLLLGGLAAVLTLAALVLWFRDSLFSSRGAQAGNSLDPAIAEGVEKQYANPPPEPVVEQDLPKGRGKLPG